MNAKAVPMSIGDRTILVSPLSVPQIQARMKERAERNARISRELREGNMLPSNRSNQFAGWLGKKPETVNAIKMGNLFLPVNAKLSDLVNTENQLVYSV